MGGSSTPDIPQRSLSDEFGQLFGTAWPQQRRAFNQFTRQEPLLNTASQFALNTAFPGLEQTFQALLPTLTSLGKLTPEQLRTADQGAESLQAQAGMTHTLPGLASTLYNRDEYRRGVFNESLQNALGIASGAEGLLLQPFQTAVSGYSALTNPLFNYASDLFSSNQNAAAAQSIAGANNKSGALGGGLSAIGSIAGGVGMAL